MCGFGHYTDIFYVIVLGFLIISWKNPSLGFVWGKTSSSSTPYMHAEDMHAPVWDTTEQNKESSKQAVQPQLLF